jgi:3-oxoacyl-[acyl-carrier-protein] synthase-3
MSQSTITGLKVTGIAAAVPIATQDISDLSAVFGADESSKIASSVGVTQRHIAPNNQCTSDYCIAAARQLLDQIAWNPSSIDGLIFVTQTPDYVLPATACTIQEKLGLSKECAAFDVNLGCSGFTYGLWLASCLLKGGGLKKVLLLCGDTISRIAAPEDRSVAALFGDAGTAVAIEIDEFSVDPWHFHLGTDGSGEKKLIVPCGGFRNKRTYESAIRSVREGNNIRSDEDLYMDGPEIFAFTLREVPKLVNNLLDAAQMTLGDIDFVVCHQANKFMLEFLAKRMKIPSEKFVLALENFGNTSSASIPLALVTHLKSQISTGHLRVLLAGFGVGFSWGGVILDFKNPTVCELVFI